MKNEHIVQNKIMKANYLDVADIREFLIYVWELTFRCILSRDTINKVIKVCYEEKILTAQIQDSAVTFLVVKDVNNNIIGVANGRLDENQVIILNRLYIHPLFQRQGIGTKLLDTMVSYFPSAIKIILEVVENNNESIKYYIDYGFEVVGSNINIIDDAILNVKIMEKKLKAALIVIN